VFRLAQHEKQATAVANAKAGSERYASAGQEGGQGPCRGREEAGRSLVKKVANAKPGDEEWQEF